MPTDSVPATPPWAEVDALDPTASFEVTPGCGWYQVGKILADYSVALLMLIPGVPLIGLCWALTRIVSPGPGFYSQTRLGRNGVPYKIVKIRTMIVNSEVTGAAWAAKNDSRVTRLGKILRLTHLDELPQLFNVLLGQMSLVGPRPERPEMIDKKFLNDLVPGYRERLKVKPGVTGFAQIQLPADSDLASVRHKVAYDLYYIQNMSLTFDLRILGGTLFKSFVSPHALRRLFLLPARPAVATVFQRAIADDPNSSDSMTNLLPV